MRGLSRHAVETPIGDVLFAAADSVVVRATIGKSEPFGEGCERWLVDHPGATRASSAFVSQVGEAIGRYFDGDVDALESVPCDPDVPEASKHALNAIRSIRAGETLAYSDVAKSLGYGRLGARFIGSVMARNPIPLLIPCHRVVGKDGSMVGYGGRLDLKEWLVAWERRHASRAQQESA